MGEMGFAGVPVPGDTSLELLYSNLRGRKAHARKKEGSASGVRMKSLDGLFLTW